jgi:hypothetical protein
VLDDVQRRSLLVQPAREDPLPAPLRVLDVELDEGSGQLLDLPGRRRFAGSKPDDRVADAHRLTRLQGQRARDAVALVEEAEHRDPLGHRSRPGGHCGDGLRNVDRARLADGLAVATRIAAAAAVAAREGDRKHDRGAEREPHAWSGVHAS